MAIIVDEIRNLHLDCLDEGWAAAIYEAEFIVFCDLPDEYVIAIQDVNLQEVFTNIMIAIDSWLDIESDEEEEEEKSWAVLSQLIPCQRLIGSLAYYINVGCKNVKVEKDRITALLASRVYYKLLSIPGYKAYNIYYSQLFTNTLTCLSFPKAMCSDESSNRELTKEVNSVIKDLSYFVNDLKAIIKELQLGPKDMNFEDILSNLVDITGVAIVTKLQVDKILLTTVTGVIYKIIDILIYHSNQQPDPVAIKLLFKCLLPKLVASSLDNRSVNSLVRASYVTYAGLLLSKYGKAAISGFEILLEHLSYDLENLERADTRTARVSLVIGLMSLLPRKSFRKMVKWLLQLSATAKILHRQIAMEMLASLLSNEPDEINPSDNTSPLDNQAEAPENNETNAANRTARNKRNEQERDGVNTYDESSQDSQVPIADLDHEITEEDVEGLLHQRPHTVPHAEILRAVYERVEDVSGTLRTRAVVILTECLESQRAPMIDAIKALHGEGAVSRLLVVGARSVCDERAGVRRAGVQLVLRLLARRSEPPLPNELSILGNMCRDASIVVRSSALAALAELLKLRPSGTVVDAFLTSCLPQLADPETKVQLQVTTFIQDLLIDRFLKFVAPGCDNPLPWMILEGIARNNMRRHLQKACLMLTKSSSCINHRLVDKLSTHLGVLDDERDLQCLVMLTSLARFVEYSDIAFVLDYYYKLADNEQDRDVRLMPLTLELLSLWSRFAQSMDRTALREHLVRRLADGHNDGCRIMCGALAAQLDPENLTWATELMQLSERRALATGELEEALRAADLSLVAPEPPQPALLRLFLAALSEPPAGRAECLGACVAGAGRLCVRSRAAAALAAPALAGLLARRAAALPARVNAVLALADICVRYTCIVEPLLETVCACLAVESPAPLRRTAVRSITRLMLGGFLRLRTPLYYRYCALLADEDHDVREPAEYYVTSCLATDTIYHHFVDCVVHYNSDTTDKIEFDARQLIYDVMLQRMSLVQRLNVQCRLAREVLDHAADVCDEGGGELPPALHAALLDAITLLCGPRMKLPKKPQNAGDAAGIDELQERVTTNIVSHKMKRTVAEVLVPAVLRLYSSLGARGGQLATYLVRIATDLLNDYQQEIDELFDNDDELLERVQQFQETIGSELTFGNVRNLVTSTAPPEPDTPRGPRRTPRAYGATPRKRALRM